jgi:hypothetical protein
MECPVCDWPNKSTCGGYDEMFLISLILILHPLPNYRFLSEHRTSFQQQFMPHHYDMLLRWILSVFLLEFILNSNWKLEFGKPKNNTANSTI